MYLGLQDTVQEEIIVIWHFTVSRIQLRVAEILEGFLTMKVRKKGHIL